MDWSAAGNRIKDMFGKYKYVLLVLAVGIMLMALPESGQAMPAATPEVSEQNTPTAEEKLESILSQIDGVGNVRVMLTERDGSETIFQTDSDSSASGDSQSDREETVVISGADRSEIGLVRQINPPRYLGAIIVCQGADRAEVQLGIVEAVSNVTGISTDRITVLKMK